MHFFGAITAFTAVAALAVGLFNIAAAVKWASSAAPSCNRSDSYGRGTTALTGRERTIGSKGCLSSRCHCKSGHKKIKHYKPKVLARQRNNYGYGNVWGYAQALRNDPRGFFIH